MLQRPEYGEGHPERLCCYCGAWADTVDHVPSKVFMDKPYPENLPVVPCCKKCNREFSLDEEYVTVLLECVRWQTFDPFISDVATHAPFSSFVILTFSNISSIPSGFSVLISNVHLFYC